MVINKISVFFHTEKIMGSFMSTFCFSNQIKFLNKSLVFVTVCTQSKVFMQSILIHKCLHSFMSLNTIDSSYLTLVKTGPAGFQRKSLLSFSCIKFWEHLLTSEVFKIFQASKNFNSW